MPSRGMCCSIPWFTKELILHLLVTRFSFGLHLMRLFLIFTWLFKHTFCEFPSLLRNWGCLVLKILLLCLNTKDKCTVILQCLFCRGDFSWDTIELLHVGREELGMGQRCGSVVIVCLKPKMIKIWHVSLLAACSCHSWLLFTKALCLCRSLYYLHCK